MYAAHCLARVEVALVVMTVPVTLLPACGGKEASIPVPAGAQAENLVGLELCTYKANKVEYDADCGTLVVPENRSNPDSRLIVLPVIRVRATGDNPAEPMFYLSGGPGTSNLHFQNLGDLIESHDLVHVGYRGEDGSAVLLTVTGVDSTNKLDMLRSIGADHVVDYAQEDYTRGGQRYDLVLDVTAHRSVFDYRRALTPEGIFCDGRRFGGNTCPGCIPRHVDLYARFGDAVATVENLNFLKELTEAGKLKAVIDRSYPLEQIAEAFRYAETGHKKGNVVITVVPNSQP